MQTNYAAVPQSPQTAHYLHQQPPQQKQQSSQLKPYQSGRSRTHSAGSSAEMPLNPSRPNENTTQGVFTGHIGGGFGPYAVRGNYEHLLLPQLTPSPSSSRLKSRGNLSPAHASVMSPSSRTQTSHSVLPSRQTRLGHPPTFGIHVIQTSTTPSTTPTLAKMPSKTLSGPSGALEAGQTTSLFLQFSSVSSSSSLAIPSSHTTAPSSLNEAPPLTSVASTLPARFPILKFLLE